MVGKRILHFILENRREWHSYGKSKNSAQSKKKSSLIFPYLNFLYSIKFKSYYFIETQNVFYCHLKSFFRYHRWFSKSESCRRTLLFWSICSTMDWMSTYPINIWWSNNLIYQWNMVTWTMSFCHMEYSIWLLSINTYL